MFIKETWDESLSFGSVLLVHNISSSFTVYNQVLTLYLVVSSKNFFSTRTEPLWVRVPFFVIRQDDCAVVYIRLSS